MLNKETLINNILKDLKYYFLYLAIIKYIN